MLTSYETSAISGGNQHICTCSNQNDYRADRTIGISASSSVEKRDFTTKEGCGNFCCVDNAYDMFDFSTFRDNASQGDIIRKMQSHGWYNCEKMYPVQ